MKKFLAVLLAAMMLLGCAAVVHAEDRVGADPALVEAAKAEGELVVYGSCEEEEGTLKDVLYKDGKTNTSRVVKPGEKDFKDGKEAVLCYKQEAPGELEIRLITGRHHQIRVQLAHAGHPILGDNKYGSEESRAESAEKGIRTIALTAWKLSFLHPVTKKQLEFTYEE